MTQDFLKWIWSAQGCDLKFLSIVGGGYIFWFLMYMVPFYFDRSVDARWRLLLILVLYLWISLLALKNCLLLTTNSIIEYIYWEYNVIICTFLKTTLQESLGLIFEMILMIFFCNKNTFLAPWELPQKLDHTT